MFFSREHHRGCVKEQGSNSRDICVTRLDNIASIREPHSVLSTTCAWLDTRCFDLRTVTFSDLFYICALTTVDWPRNREPSWSHAASTPTRTVGPRWQGSRSLTCSNFALLSVRIQHGGESRDVLETRAPRQSAVILNNGRTQCV